MSRAPSPRALARALEATLLALQSLLVLSTGYLLVLLAGARQATRKRTLERDLDAHTRFAVLIPAHNEEQGIDATLASIAGCDYPADRRHVIVIADNCSDQTAACARQAGVEVWERTDPTKKDKGSAVMWALERLSASRNEFDAVVMLDADCLVSQNMLAAMDVALHCGAHAVQVSYVVGNPEESHASALRFAAFTLMATVRPLGKQAFGLSCGLFGTGMAFTMEVLREEPWKATGFGEDFEYHLRLVDAGKRVEFLHKAWVKSAMPTSFAVSAEQQARWEKGKLVVIRRWGSRLMLSGLRHRDFVRMHAGFEQLVPPQSLIAAGTLGSALAAVLLRSRRLLWCSLATLAAQSLLVVGGLRLVRAPASVYRGLIAAPMLIADKVVLYVRMLRGRGPTVFKTEREMSKNQDDRG
jgi:1,2-diacylglycerol 3-beta-glucosyltransferase